MTTKAIQTKKITTNNIIVDFNHPGVVDEVVELVIGKREPRAGIIKFSKSGNKFVISGRYYYSMPFPRDSEKKKIQRTVVCVNNILDEKLFLEKYEEVENGLFDFDVVVKDRNKFSELQKKIQPPDAIVSNGPHFSFNYEKDFLFELRFRNLTIEEARSMYVLIRETLNFEKRIVK